MKQSLHALAFFVIALFATIKTFAQDSTAVTHPVYFSGKVLKKVNAKSETINNKLTDQTEKYLKRMAKEEQKLRRKLSRINQAAAEKIFGNAENQYALLQQKIKNTSGKTSAITQKYLPHLDSLQTALKFLNIVGGIPENDLRKGMLTKKALSNIDLLQNKFSQADDIKQYMQQRKTYLQNQLASFGLTKNLVKFQKQVYYYQAKMEAYKEDFNNPSLLEAKALAALQKTTLFKNFFKGHSQLAGLFRLPETSPTNPIAGFAAFQTRETVEQQLLQRFGSLPDVQRMASHPIAPGPSKLNQLKTDINKRLVNNDDAKTSGFVPNNQRTRSFLKRLELGTNLQTVKGNNFFPSTSDLALSLGYKLNDNSTVGIGSSYKMGWGKDIRHFAISHQGIGLRSFVDVKLKGSFWVSGGAEMNYRSQFTNFEILDDYSPWQKSALLGLSKKYRISKTVKGNMQLMYDFLSKQQIPRAQPVVFRIGYTLK